MRRMTAEVTSIALFALVAFTATGAQRIEDAYFAPENQLIFRMVYPDGVIRQFDRDYTRQGTMRSADGWSARFFDQASVEITPDSGVGDKFLFDRGRLVRATMNGEVKNFQYDQRRQPVTGMVPPLQTRIEDSRAKAKEHSYNEFLHKWDGSGRLAFPFVNPNQNGALYAELFVLFVFAAVWFRRISAKIGFSVLALASFACLVWTISRGAWLGVALALMPAALVGIRKKIRSWRFWGMVVLALSAIVVSGWILGQWHLIRGFDIHGNMNWSNAVRVEIWKNAPKLLHDAPGGWGFCGPGVAYLNWYQPLQVFALLPTLINSHLTLLATWGWFGRFVYLFLVAFFFMGAGWLFLRRGNFLPFALGMVFFTAAWFNPMSHRPELWALPILSSWLFLREAPWHRWKMPSVFAGAAVVVSVAICLALNWQGAVDAAGGEYIRAEGRRVMVHGPNPRIWLVDDGTVGGGLSGKDIREYYSVVKTAPALGYVTNIQDLPKKVDKLILVGQSCFDWLTLLSENESARANLPRKVIFISPSFSPSCIPPALFEHCLVSVMVGEFAALHDPEYANPPKWVNVIPGMERYILRWMQYAIEG